MSPTNLLMLFLLLMSIALISSSSSMFTVWMLLEINTISFVSLMFIPSNQEASESSMKYFLPQALASSLFIMAIMIPNNSPLFNISSLIILLAMLIKLGAAPFHYWFPTVVNKNSWPINLALMTFQKIPPFFVLTSIPLFYYFSLVIMTSALVGSLGGMNQTNIKSLMAFSSISHMGWMLASLTISSTFWLMYLFLYSIIMITLCFILNKKISTINQMISATNKNKLLFILILLSLGGLPPMTGFFQKWLIITMMNNPLVIIILLLSALLNLFFYIRLSFPLIILNSSKTIWTPNQKMSNNNSLYLFLSIMFLPAIFLFSPLFL